MSEVVSHPSFRQIPDCLLPLVTDEAREEYATIARIMFDSGRMTMSSHRSLSAYAMMFDSIIRRSKEGIIVNASSFHQLETFKRRLKIDDFERPVASAKDASQNKFARNGFSARNRRSGARDRGQR
jgi:hypothetical protein